MFKTLTLTLALATATLFASAAEKSGMNKQSGPESRDEPTQVQGEHQKKISGDLSQVDKKFVRDVSRGNSLEVELSRIAVERASSDQVKQFAQRLLDDHTKAGEKLSGIVPDRLLASKTDWTDEQRSMINHFRSLSGAEFDRAFISHMVTDHKTDISKFEDFVRSGHNDQLKSFAEGLLPGLREHLTIARDLSGSIKSGTARGKESMGREFTPTGSFKSDKSMKHKSSGKQLNRSGSSSGSSY